MNHGNYNPTPPMYYRSFSRCLAVLCVFAMVFPLQSLAQGQVEGRVIDEETRKPVVQANLIFRQNSETQGTATNEEGRFRLPLAPGEYTVDVESVR